MDLAGFAGGLNSAAGALTGPAMKSVMDTLGVAAKKDAEAAVRADLGGDLKFSGWRTANLQVRYDHTAPGQIELTPTPGSRGPWKVAESGRRPGRIPKRGGRKLINIPGVGPRWATAANPISTGRTAGKNTFTDAKREWKTKTAKRAEPLIVNALRKEIGV